MRHVETKPFRDIREAVEYAKTGRKAVAIMGNYGIGKTHSLRWIAERDNLASYWLVETARASFKAACKAYLAALGFPCHYEHTDRVWNDVDLYTSSAAGYGGYVLVDEAHRLPLNFLVELVDFPERYGLPIVIAGNPDLLKRTRINAGAMGQISSRCARTITLRAPSADDFTIVAADYDVMSGDARAAVVEYGRNTSLREAVAMLETARGLADRGPIRLPELKQAAAYHRGVSLLVPAA